MFSENIINLTCCSRDSIASKKGAGFSLNNSGIRIFFRTNWPCLAQYLIYFVSLTERDSIYCVRTFFIRVKVFLQRGSDSFVNDTLKLQPTRHRQNQSRWHLTTPPIIMLLICLYQWSNSLILPRS